MAACEAVVDHDLGGGEEPGRLQGEELRVAEAGADEGDGHRTAARRVTAAATRRVTAAATSGATTATSAPQVRSPPTFGVPTGPAPTGLKG